MILVSGLSASISASVAKPSLVPSGSGGRPRSSVTTAGSRLRSASIASRRVAAPTSRWMTASPGATSSPGTRFEPGPAPRQVPGGGRGWPAPGRRQDPVEHEPGRGQHHPGEQPADAGGDRAGQQRGDR